MNLDFPIEEQDANKLTQRARAAKEQMLAIVSHDIKNPLSAIQLEAQMLLRAAERHSKSLLSEEVKIQANRIIKTTERLKGLIADLLDRNKSSDGLGSLNKNLCDVSKLYQEVFDFNRPLFKQKEITVTTSFPSEVQLHLDKSKVFQVLSNLVINAIKFSPPRGQIHLEIEENEHLVTMSVSDNGPGVNISDRCKIFEKYWTGSTSGTGTGLGLFICKTIVDAHHGHIGVDNNPSGGAKFWFKLPKSAHAFPDFEKKIIIIDDDDDLREVVRWALEHEGYQVHTYADPHEALMNLRKGKHIPSLIIVDYQMDEMNGREFLNLIRDSETLKNCPALMISASPEEAESQNGVYSELITKPLDLSALLERIKSYVTN